MRRTGWRATGVIVMCQTTLLFGVARAATHTAASCARADVQAAVNAAVDGDTVLIPAGTATWTNGIETTKQIMIQAQTITPTPGGDAAWNVVITNNSPVPLITMTSGDDFHCGVAGITFMEGSRKTNYIRIQGTGSNVPLVHDCRFDIDERFGDEPGIAVLACLSTGGVIWNCMFDTPGADFQGYPGSQGASVYIHSPRDWYTPSTMGALDSNGTVNVYFEDCTFFNCSGCPDIDDNGRVVFRHCLFDGTGGLTHGFTSMRGGRHFEYYDNTFTVTTPERNQARYFWCRAGTGLFTDNVVSNCATPSAFGNQTLLAVGDNTVPTGYPQSRQPGWGYDGTRDVIDPMYIWNNTGPRAGTWDVYADWTNSVRLNRELYVDSGPKPGYTKYAYPHPVRDDALPPLPEGAGLAAAYPDDAGIAGHADVLFTENFESFSGDRISWSEIGGWDNVYGNLLITRDAANVNRGSQAVRITCTGTAQQSHGVVKQVAGQERLFVRWYMKFHPAFPGCHHTGLSIRGGRAGDLFANPTGTVPNGTNFFWVCLDHLSPLHSWNPAANTEPPGWVYNYCYHMDQDTGWGDVLLSTGPLNGSDKLGPDFVPRPNVTPPRDRWICYELMVQNNTPGERDGRVGVWIDGNLVADHPNLRFRGIAEIASRFINLGVYSSAVFADQTVWYDDLVAATRYIGPIAAGNVDVVPPAAPRGLRVQAFAVP
ncbi:MAG: hypothetical protein JXR37_26920 [Kiritimatiellae bacterium]|nr:hypothetical protein [Kiritimatiellia bacterium]